MNCDMDGKDTHTHKPFLFHFKRKVQCGHIFPFLCLSQKGDMENQVEVEEKTRLINQVLELQHTLEGKS